MRVFPIITGGSRRFSSRTARRRALEFQSGQDERRNGTVRTDPSAQTSVGRARDSSVFHDDWRAYRSDTSASRTRRVHNHFGRRPHCLRRVVYDDALSARSRCTVVAACIRYDIDDFFFFLSRRHCRLAYPHARRFDESARITGTDFVRAVTTS